jgi:CBS domain-containing protein
MNAMKVADLMIPLEEYPVVPKDVTLLDALAELRAAVGQDNGRSRARAVLVIDGNHDVVGKIDQLSVLMALEPKFTMLGDMQMLDRSGVSPEDVTAMMSHYQLFQGDLESLCLRTRGLSVRDVMRSVEESIDETAPLADAIHKIAVWQTLSIMVKREGRVVGILRLSDLFDTLSSMMLDGDA